MLRANNLIGIERPRVHDASLITTVFFDGKIAVLSPYSHPPVTLLSVPICQLSPLTSAEIACLRNTTNFPQDDDDDDDDDDDVVSRSTTVDKAFLFTQLRSWRTLALSPGATAEFHLIVRVRGG